MRDLDLTHQCANRELIVVHLATREVGAVADKAEKKKKTKYTHLEASHYFAPVVVDSLGFFGPEAQFFFQDLDRCLKDSTSESLSHHYLMQRISVAVQRGNTAGHIGHLALFPI